eukprot:Phypoly_transcript_02262.p1 GENE.Phypoly_transcript_02262~~Phypoly_transcript_02262.p1  ORF type:complete len:880 (+),score=183.72 Phypoly_transcript_02262:244-2883(+)
MEAGDIVNELSTSNIVEDDLNGIFNSLEPLEDPKDDMFFFNNRDLLQKIRERNPANTTVTVHKPNSTNKPSPPSVSNNNGTDHSGELSHTLVPTATCDPQPPLAPLAHHAKPLTSSNNGNHTKHFSAAAIASATASAMYLGNYLAATNDSTANTKNPPLTITPAPPPLFDKPTSKPSDKSSTKPHHQPGILRRSSHKTSRRSLSKSHPAYTSYASLTAPIVVPGSGPSDKFSGHPIQLSSSNPNLLASQNSSTQQSVPIQTPSTNFPDLSGANFAPTLKTSSPLKTSTGIPIPKTNTPTKKSPHLKSSNELKRSGVIYNPNNGTNPLHQSAEPVPGNVVAPTVTQASNNPLAASGNIPRNIAPTVETPTNLPNQATSQQLLSNITTTNNNGNNSKQDNNNNLNTQRQITNLEYMAYAAYNPYLSYPPGFPVNAFYANQIPSDVYVAGHEAAYTTRPESQAIFTPSVEPTPVHSTPNTSSNDLYSNLYFYSFNNNVYNTNANNNPNAYARATPPIPDPNSTYNNLYSYNNLYLNGMYGYPTYPTRDYPVANYFSHKNTSTYDNQPHRSSEAFEEDYDDEDDYRADRKKHSKRSKHRSTDDDEYHKPPRKSKHRHRNKHSKPPLPQGEVHLRDSVEFSATNTSTEVPKTDGPALPAPTTPVTPARIAQRSKSSANLFENTPKIKIGETQGGNAKISKLGRKLLEVVRLDWRTPYAQELPCSPKDQSTIHGSDAVPGSSSSHPGAAQNQDKLSEPHVSLDQQGSWISGSQEASTSGLTNIKEEKASVFTDYDATPDRKTELLYFVANNIESLLTIPTKIEITLHDFKSSALGAKVRQRLEILETIKQAQELGLILEDQYVAKQQQFLDVFTFGVANPEKKET